jgi:Winged helix DNA-binding domain
MDLVAERLSSQLLTGAPADSPEAVVRRRLAVRARSAGLTAAHVDRSFDDRSLVVSWLNRGTLHLVAAEDYWWLHPLTTPQLAVGNARRLRQEGVSPSEAIRAIDLVGVAVSEGPQTREDLRSRLAAAGIPTAGQALVHILFAATLVGIVVRGPRGTDFASVADWLGPAPPPLRRDEALARLASRYLAGHAPAEPRDLAKWAGISLGAARTAFAGADPPPERAIDRPRARLLGAFDPLLLGWASRELFVGRHPAAITSNGIFRPVALGATGRVVAIWALPGGVPTVRPLEAINRATLAALRAESTDVLRYLGIEHRPMAVEPTPGRSV